MTRRTRQLQRVLRMVADLATATGATVYELAERHGVTTRTVWRDLAAIEAAGVPVVDEQGDERATRFRVAFPCVLADVARRADG